MDDHLEDGRFPDLEGERQVSNPLGDRSQDEKGEAMSDCCAEIGAAKVEALVAVLRTALPQLVADAFAAFKADKFAVSTIAAGLSDAEWKRLKRDENRRRRAVVSERQ